MNASGLRADMARAPLPSFTLATYVHLLPEDLPGADLDSLTSSESEVAAGHQNAVRGNSSENGA